MNPLEKRGKVDKLIARLNNEILVVEGKRDEAALRDIGVTGDIVIAVGNIERLVNRIASKCRGEPAVILFDFDETGNERTSQLSERLIHEGFPPDIATRKTLRRLLGLRFFEEADSKYDKLLEQVENQTKMKKIKKK